MNVKAGVAKIIPTSQEAHDENACFVNDGRGSKRSIIVSVNTALVSSKRSQYLLNLAHVSPHVAVTVLEMSLPLQRDLA